MAIVQKYSALGRRLIMRADVLKSPKRAGKTSYIKFENKNCTHCKYLPYNTLSVKIFVS